MARTIIDTGVTELVSVDFPNNTSTSAIRGGLSRLKAWAAAINAMTLELYPTYSATTPITAPAVGTIVYNSAPVSGGHVGWIYCVGGVWREWGVVANS